ncbi:hypothetical protein [Sphingomonas oligophenolica]|uniref:Uncharacterized protein n=1 Tax=Sphingomonas oligophenolica TaxID=301154 RepID=A0A502CH26_9SPHN|nr:hypothetical protein [Sphingomonas oligophenolica]TPG12477.1 hypothetical protein EAH84_09430 [Sphingomonas oligophenolica]
MHIDHYDWTGADGVGGREAMLRFSTGTPRVVLALPLFEEFNRTRAFGVTLLRALARRGIGGLLPDWPGTNESPVPSSDATLAMIQAAYQSVLVSCTPLFALGIRSGALFDARASVRGRWHLSPVSGTELARELARQTSDDGTISGNLVSSAFRAELGAASLGSARVVRFDSDPRDADLKLAGSPLWRRAEPGNDPALAEVLAADITHWVATCDG